MTRLEKSIYISNGLDWSPNGPGFYFMDTNRHVIYRYNYNLGTGEFHDKNIFIQFKENEFPDDLCIDAEGDLCVICNSRQQ